MWSPVSAQLYRVGSGVDPTTAKNGEESHLKGAEILTFPPGTYHRIIREDVEILPSDGKNSNDWIRGQECVRDCRFRFEKKRPATIRAHFISCRLRVSLEPDPIRRLCQLQTSAQRRFKAPSIMGRSATISGHQLQASNEGPELFMGNQTPRDRTYSLSATDDDGDDEGGESAYDEYDSHHAPSPLHYGEEEAQNHDAFALSALVESSSMQSPEAQWDAPPSWLTSYGLEAPTTSDQSNARFDLPPVAPSTHESSSGAGSFLSMDED
ncbi:hypothetical protein MNV49_002551 [Pseudohyphozyma bogoriensis]|nr:hypothetical protein MNV49_002551 [Pseudohyphozyma bogoriensis]